MATILSEVNCNEEIDIKINVRKKHLSNKPSFGMLVNTTRRSKVTGLDMHSILQNLSKGSTWIYWEFIENRDSTTNTVYYMPKTVADRRRLTKAYKELNKLQIIKRVRQGKYLINPDSFIPSDNKYEEVKILWQTLP